MMSARQIAVADTAKIALTDELKCWAKAFASNGYPVFPSAIVSGRKQPLVKIGRGEEHGSLATADPKQIDVWWSRWPLAMIAMPTGRPSGLMVIDIDVKSGVDGFDTMRRIGWTMPPEAIEVVTPSGGSHFYFEMPADEDIRCSAGKVGPGVDIRANGGIVILPPSRPNFGGGDYHYAEGQECEMGMLTW